MIFDPMYLVFVAPAMILALWAQWRVKSAYATASGLASRSGRTGADAARAIMKAAGVSGVQIEETGGVLSDHYDPRHKVLRLSHDVFQGRSLAALGIAAHEAGHAIQHAHAYAPLALRNGLVPLASVGGNLSMVLIVVGLLVAAAGLLWGQTVLLAGIGLFSLTVLFQLVNLPVEFNASSRAREALLSIGLVDAHEEQEVRKVLSAAAMTYVAATVTAVLTLLYYLWRAGLLGGRRE
jgi:Zn-dependent membrane protease YugP